MHLKKLSQRESKVIGEILRAAADGPFFPDWEFHTLFGLSREQVRGIADEWPLPITAPDIVVLAINNSINNLLAYPHKKHELWSDWISVSRDDMDLLYKRLRGRN